MNVGRIPARADLIIRCNRKENNSGVMENKVEICQSLDFEFMSFLRLPNILQITKAKQREERKKKSLGW